MSLKKVLTGICNISFHGHGGCRWAYGEPCKGYIRPLYYRGNASPVFRIPAVWPSDNPHWCFHG